MRLIITAGSIDSFTLLQYLIGRQALGCLVFSKALCDYCPRLPRQLAFAAVPFTVFTNNRNQDERN